MAISETTYEKIGEPDMQNTSKTLYGPVGLSLKVCGQFIANFSYK